MNFSKIQNLTKVNTVLVAPLDWGLGHATRCIPIIKALLKLDCTVILGTSGSQKKILAEAFPDLRIEDLTGYEIRYSKNRHLFLPVILMQLPKIFRILMLEHRWLKKVVATQKIDAVISDNRFGLYHPSIKTVYITHQVALKTGIRCLDGLAAMLHRVIIKKFGNLWIPDFEAAQKSLAGELSHPQKLPINAQYIGGISRFELGEKQPKLYDIVAVLSGPEPQRSMLESVLLASFRSIKGRILLVRGLPTAGTVPLPDENGRIIIKNHLSGPELNVAMMQAEVVLCRSGYTSVMDLIKIRQKAILIATPGQTEQEYLADYLHKRNIFLSVDQHNFNLEHALQKAANFPFAIPEVSMDQYEAVLTKFVQSL